MPLRKPILRSCCCWRSLRTGSYASGAYSLAYFLVIILTMSHLVYEERMYLMGNQTSPESISFIEPKKISKTTMILNIILLTCACLGVPSTFLLFVGVYKDWRALLLPWIATMVFDIVLEFVHIGLTIFMSTTNFNPITAVLYTVDFFLVVVHLYATLCVISQYQEYMLGGGTAADEDIRHGIQMQSLNDGNSKVQNLMTDVVNPNARDIEVSTRIRPPVLNTSGTKSQSSVQKKVKFPDEALAEESLVQKDID